MTRYLIDIDPGSVPICGHVTITKIEKLPIDTWRKTTESKRDFVFTLRRKVKKLSQKNSFTTVASTFACRFQNAIFLERIIEAGFYFILLIYGIVYMNIKDWYAGYAATSWWNLPKVKDADLDWSKSHKWWSSPVNNYVSKQGRRGVSSLYIITC